jgi:hypothetical protein
MIPSSDCRPWRSDRSGSSGILVVSPSARPRLGTRSPWRLHQKDNVSPGWRATRAKAEFAEEKHQNHRACGRIWRCRIRQLRNACSSPFSAGACGYRRARRMAPMSASLFRCRESAGGSPRVHNLGAATSSASVLESRGVLTPRWRTRDARARERRSAMTVRPLGTGLPSGWRAYSGAPSVGASVEWNARGALGQPSLYPLTLRGPTWRTISSMSQRRMPISHSS